MDRAKQLVTDLANQVVANLIAVEGRFVSSIVEACNQLSTIDQLAEDWK